MRFTVLASGSSGNASLVEVDGFGLLLDAGLGPRQLASRLMEVGRSWNHVHAALLTHTHGDHWRERTFAHLRRRGIPLYCHELHRAALAQHSLSFAGLMEGRLVRTYDAEEELHIAAGLRCRPIPVPHDGAPTFGFRLEGSPDLFGEAFALGYAADLGSWTPELARRLADVDLLALEFNHDEHLERSSGRSPLLIQRVLGPLGHLSNTQAASLVRAVLGQSAPGRLRHLVLLHLSRECNRPALALAAARAALAGTTTTVKAARHDRPLAPMGATTSSLRRIRTVRPRTVNRPQAMLPGNHH